MQSCNVVAIVPVHPRTCLPAPMFSRNDVSIWSILKKCIGMVRKLHIINTHLLFKSFRGNNLLENVISTRLQTGKSSLITCIMRTVNEFKRD